MESLHKQYMCVCMRVCESFTFTALPNTTYCLVKVNIFFPDRSLFSEVFFSQKPICLSKENNLC